MKNFKFQFKRLNKRLWNHQSSYEEKNRLTSNLTEEGQLAEAAAAAVFIIKLIFHGK